MRHSMELAKLKSTKISCDTNCFFGDTKKRAFGKCPNFHHVLMFFLDKKSCNLRILLCWIIWSRCMNSKMERQWLEGSKFLLFALFSIKTSRTLMYEIVALDSSCSVEVQGRLRWKSACNLELNSIHSLAIFFSNLNNFTFSIHIFIFSTAAVHSYNFKCIWEVTVRNKSWLALAYHVLL